MTNKTELRDTIVFCRSWHEAFKATLTPEQYVKVVQVLLDYNPNEGVMPKTGDPVVDASAMMCKYVLDENHRNWLARKKGGQMGGRPRKDGTPARHDNGGDATA